MIPIDVARGLLNLGSRIGEGRRAEEQLEGAVALHNILEKRGVAYLADEVGMGKTYVALGAIALFRHFDPGFRVLIIAPRENIQIKWMKELRNFIAHNIRFPDLRVKAVDGRPARSLVSCENLVDLVHQVALDPNRDFFLRLTSFSLPVAGRETVDPAAATKLRDGLREALPWMADEVFNLHNKQAFKDNVARAICCALPLFDLVVVDEAHNLKQGFSEHVSARNRVLALAMGHPAGAGDEYHFPGYGPRARRVLLLSATPIEETYRHLWNQLALLGRSSGYDGLKRDDVDEDEKKKLVADFLVRRVTSIRAGGNEYTKNLYRREWRRGGVTQHDEPIHVNDPRQRLIVALVQKKVSELLRSERFGTSYQVGMLASFESFLETTKLKRVDDETCNFDDAEQTEDDLEREGIDVRSVNRLAKTYRERFGHEMPHPKMDALVDSLATAWTRGEKALVFVRRVASVKELKRKLDERYNTWLFERLRSALRDRTVNSEVVSSRLEQTFVRYQQERAEALSRDEVESVLVQRDDADRGGTDTFFAWFFRGEGPRGIVSGANIQQRFIQRGASYATFFKDNYVADVLGCRPGEVLATLASRLETTTEVVRGQLQQRSARFLSRAKKHARADRVEAVQAAAIEWLKDAPGAHQEAARIAWHELFEASLRPKYTSEPPDIGDWIELRTFFTELRGRPALRQRLWPEVKAAALPAFRERELRGQLLTTAARLGNAFIDLYIMTIQRLGSLDLRAQETQEDDASDVELERIHSYLGLLEEQQRTPRSERHWGAFDELSDLAEHFSLILDVNAPDAASQQLSETSRTFGQMLRQQQPVGGMAGQVNQTLVRQFRLPGYPLVLITTDLLQEGEDLHTFCSAVHHYGISWTPSSMEQRIGRIDRVRSATDRRLEVLGRAPHGEELLQVYFPHLEDTVEVLQVQRVLERMNVFLRLMHEGISTAGPEDRTIDTTKEFVRGRRPVLQIRERLRSAFPVLPDHLVGDAGSLATTPDVVERLLVRFHAFVGSPLGALAVRWEQHVRVGTLLGTAKVNQRTQPFSLVLRSVGARPLVRCISPVGRVGLHEADRIIEELASRMSARLGAILTEEHRTYNLTVEDDVLLADDAVHDDARVAAMVARVVESADQLEMELLVGRDEPLDTFRKDLEAEGGDGR